MNRLDTAADLENAFNEWNVQLYRYVCARVGNSETAEEIVQETFIKAWNHRTTYDAAKSSLKNWLFVILINTTRDYFRAKKHNTEILDENLSAPENIEREFESRDQIAFIFRKVKTLSERDQELLLLRYTEGLGIEEIASLLGLQYSATKVALHRAVQKLKMLCQNEPT